MECPNCGKENNPFINYCPKCGLKVSRPQCPKCDSGDYGENFCWHCGAHYERPEK